MSRTATIYVRHTVQLAHRLIHLPGKCERIHGHGVGVLLELRGELDPQGLLAGLDFGHVKRKFRCRLDEVYDHRLLLNSQDPLVKLNLPGMRTTAGDPTTEHLAAWIADWAVEQFPGHPVRVVVDETCTNGATVAVGW